MIQPLHTNARFGSTLIQKTAGPLELLLSSMWIASLMIVRLPFNFNEIHINSNNLKNIQYEHLK